MKKKLGRYWRLKPIVLQQCFLACITWLENPICDISASIVARSNGSNRSHCLAHTLVTIGDAIWSMCVLSSLILSFSTCYRYFQYSCQTNTAQILQQCSVFSSFFLLMYRKHWFLLIAISFSHVCSLLCVYVFTWVNSSQKFHLFVIDKELYDNDATTIKKYCIVVVII